jgi:hypothetical protein
MKKKGKKIVNHHKPFIESFFWVIISFIIAFILYETGSFHTILASLQEFGYIGAFIAGMFFVSVFTAAPAAIVLVTFAETLPMLPLVLIAGAGSVAGDMIMLSLINKQMSEGISFFPKEKGIQKIIKTLRHTKYRFFLTIVGAIVIASPLPDELGLALMGVSNIKPVSAVAITFLLNTFGLWLLLSVFRM